MKANYISTTIRKPLVSLGLLKLEHYFITKIYFSKLMEPPQTYQELYEAGDRINENLGKAGQFQLLEPMLGSSS